jgi:hypothetical protein
MWMAGGGVKGGITQGKTDHYGLRTPSSGRVPHRTTLHATMLHLLGLDHTNASPSPLRSAVTSALTDVHGRVVKEVVA